MLTLGPFVMLMSLSHALPLSLSLPDFEAETINGKILGFLMRLLGFLMG